MMRDYNDNELDNYDVILAQQHLREMATVFRQAYPITTELKEDDCAPLRSVLASMLRDMKDEPDTKLDLVIFCGWFVSEAPKDLLTRFMMWIEDRDESLPLPAADQQEEEEEG
jgi:hypothetical protein